MLPHLQTLVLLIDISMFLMVIIKYFWTNKMIKLMLIFTLLGYKRIFPDLQGRYIEIQQNILPENPLPTLMEMGLMIV